MSAGAAALLPLSSLDDDAWDDLLSFIEERRVIPIIGPELGHSRNLALALVGQNRETEAREAIAPAVTFMRDIQKRNRQNEDIRIEVAMTLYVEALTDPARRAALLRKAAAMIDATPATIRSLGEVKQWRERIRAAG